MAKDNGKSVQLWLPAHLVAALQQDAKDNGEPRIQPVIRQILEQHYAQQLAEARQAMEAARACVA